MGNYIFPYIQKCLEILPDQFKIASSAPVMASHQTYYGQIKHLSSQIKFGRTNLLYIINGEVIEYSKDMYSECLDNFHSLSYVLLNQ